MKVLNLEVNHDDSTAVYMGWGGLKMYSSILMRQHMAL
jgi:hypothetical protein